VSVLNTESLAEFGSALRNLDQRVDDVERIDQLRLLEQLKSAAAAAQARVTARFARSQRSEQEVAGVPAKDLGKGVAGQVALARRDSPAKGARHLGLANALVKEMPHTLAALERGVISEWRATILVRETACLSRQDRSKVDAEVAGRLGSMGDKRTGDEARKIAYRLDPESVVARSRKAATERRVTIRPAPDTMACVTGLLPAQQGVAVFAALTRHADTLKSQGDERSRGQIMADTFVERLTGQVAATRLPVEVSLVMTPGSLFWGESTPAHLQGYGPLPAGVARNLVRAGQAQGGEARLWVRRLFTSPGGGSLVGMESSRRCFPKGLRRFLVLRDQTCRTPYCDAPIRHIDHPAAVQEGGSTSAENGQGLCEACNYAKQASGWQSRQTRGGRIETTTPTGHTYHSRPPPPVTFEASASCLDIAFREIIDAA
jgi:Domain of unknown function (DUF222)